MKTLLMSLGILFAINTASYGFHITLGRDPFMDLIKMQKLIKKEMIMKLSKQKGTVNEINQKVGMILSSTKVTMVVLSKNNPGMKACLLVGPSGVPIVAVKGQKLADGVYVDDITGNGVKIKVVAGNQEKVVFLKIAR